MRLSDFADTIKRSVTATQAARAIGLNPDSKGFCRCPFHGEKTASMKLYPGSRGWWCFGCNHGGSVIDLIMEYYGMGFREAIEFMNNEFQLGLPIGYTPTKEQEEEAKRRAAERDEKQRQQQEKKAMRDAAFRRYCDVSREIAECEIAISDYAPKNPGDDFDARFIEAMQKIETLKDEAKDLEMTIFEKEEDN